MSQKDNLISRQAAIDKFEPWLKVRGYSEGELNMLKAVLYELRFLPSVQPEILACGEGELNVPDTNVGDMIHSQAAIDALGERPMVWVESDYELGARNQYDADVLALETVPSVQPEQQWIPCSESLPEDEQPILFSTTTGRVHQGRFHRDNSVNRWYSSLDKMRAYNNVVNAWMPLPEPYKEDDHD